MNLMAFARAAVQAQAARNAAPAAQPIALPPEQYFRLMSAAKDVQLATQALREAERVLNAYMAELDGAYPGLDLRAIAYQGDDATCTLRPMTELKEGTT